MIKIEKGHLMKYILYVTLFFAGMAHAASQQPYDDSEYEKTQPSVVRYLVENRQLDPTNEYESSVWQSMVEYVTTTKKKPLSQLTEADWLEARIVAEKKQRDNWVDGLLNELSSDDELRDD